MDSLDLRVIGIQFFIYPNKWKSNKKKLSIFLSLKQDNKLTSLFSQL